MTLPLLAPAITIVATLTLIIGLRVFDQVLALTGGGPVDATETLATQVYQQTFVNGRFGYGAALALVLTVLDRGPRGRAARPSSGSARSGSLLMEPLPLHARSRSRASSSLLAVAAIWWIPFYFLVAIASEADAGRLRLAAAVPESLDVGNFTRGVEGRRQRRHARHGRSRTASIITVGSVAGR